MYKTPGFEIIRLTFKFNFNSRYHLYTTFTIMATEITASTTGQVYTTSNGRPITYATASQRVGQNGPILLQDFHLIDLIAHFDRERIPERVVHAKGAGAYGEFEVTHDITNIVCPNCGMCRHRDW